MTINVDHTTDALYCNTTFTCYLDIIAYGLAAHPLKSYFRLGLSNKHVKGDFSFLNQSFVWTLVKFRR